MRKLLNLGMFLGSGRILLLSLGHLRSSPITITHTGTRFGAQTYLGAALGGRSNQVPEGEVDRLQINPGGFPRPTRLPQSTLPPFFQFVEPQSCSMKNKCSIRI